MVLGFLTFGGPGAPPPNSSPLRFSTQLQAFAEPLKLILTQIKTHRMMEGPWRQPGPGPGPAIVYAQQVSGAQFPNLSSQGITLDDFQGTFWLCCMNQLSKLLSFV